MHKHDCRLVIKTGVGAKDYEHEEATKNLLPLERDLKRLEDVATAYVRFFFGIGVGVGAILKVLGFQGKC